MKDVSIQFFSGFDEKIDPRIMLPKSKDGQAGQPFFRLNNPEDLF